MSLDLPALREILGEDRIHTGFGRFDVLGHPNDEMVDRNRERAGLLRSCAHCGRGVREETGSFAIVLMAREQDFVRWDVPEETLLALVPSDSLPPFQIVILGSECAKNLPPEWRLSPAEYDARGWDLPDHCWIR